MCRVVGFRDLSENPGYDFVKTIEKMRDTMTNGGPDDAGIYVDRKGGVAFGHRRLSIIDLSKAGHQPMSTPDGRLTIVFNGEIYNFVEIKEKLIQQGYKFKSHTDTEVVLYAFKEWGKSFLKYLHGMFALAIYDKYTGEIFIARDRIGIKPVYFYKKNNLFVFSSQIRAILEHPEFRKEIDAEGLSAYLKLGYIPDPLSIFQNVKKLSPGNYLIVNKKNELHVEKYWSVPVIDRNITEQEATDRLEDLLTESIKYRLISDVPVGIFLSSGIDSTLITALLRKISPKVFTFTIGFEDPSFDESKHAQKIAQFLGTHHNELILSTKEAQNILKKYPLIYDEPFSDSSGIPTYLVSKLAKSTVKVVLSADGGDELFAGYNTYKFMNKIDSYFPLLKILMSEYFYNFLYTINSKSRLKISRLREILRHKTPSSRFIELESHFSDSCIIKLTGDEYSIRSVNHLLDKKNSEFGILSDKLKLYELSDLINYLPGDILVKVDRATMENSIEGREPFLDHNVVEFAMSLPSKLKYKSGTGKYVLKKLLKRYLPEELIQKEKHGFSIPLSKWLKNDLKPLANYYLSKKFMKKYPILNSDIVSEMYSDFKENPYSNGRKIWTVISLNMWAERWL